MLCAQTDGVGKLVKSPNVLELGRAASSTQSSRKGRRRWRRSSGYSPAAPADDDAIWRILEQPFAPEKLTHTARFRPDANAHWCSPGHTVWVEDGHDVGTYYLRANNRGGGAHVANCGYVVATDAFGRGVARAMCLHSLDRARTDGFNAMQFNFVIASNERAVRLWQNMGFAIAGRLPGAFRHPRLGDVEAYVMFRNL